MSILFVPPTWPGRLSEAARHFSLVDMPRRIDNHPTCRHRRSELGWTNEREGHANHHVLHRPGGGGDLSPA